MICTAVSVCAHAYVCVFIIVHESNFSEVVRIIHYYSGIKKYIVGLIIKLSSTSESLEVGKGIIILIYCYLRLL